MPIAYDITRLVTRMFTATPNGIDRVDFAYAQHFLAAAAEDRFGLIINGLAPRLFSCAAARAAIDGIAAHWGEDRRLEEDVGYRAIVAHLTGASTSQPAERRIVQGRSGRTAGVLRWLMQYGLPLGRPPQTDLPKGACYINVSQFPLWIGRYFEWLESRRDVKAVFFIHDLLPIEMPECFRDGEEARHRQRLVNVARFAAGAVVSSEAVAAALSAFMRDLGRPDLPICVEPLPCAPIFATPKVVDPELRRQPYFIVCGTIEPRKNLPMLLHVWRRLVEQDGEAAPRLVLVGSRGWKFEPVVDLLQRAPALRTHVIEVQGLTTPALKMLLDNARALLMPSFAEGFGLPVREALMARASVVAADIPAFRGIVDSRLTRLSPLDGEAWLAKVRALARDETAHDEASAPSLQTSERYFAKIEAFVAAL